MSLYSNILNINDLEDLELKFSNKCQKAKLIHNNEKLRYLKINNVKLGDEILLRKINNNEDVFYIDIILNNEIFSKISMIDDFILNNIELQNKWNIEGNLQLAYEYIPLIKCSSVYINEYGLKLKSKHLEIYDQNNNSISYLLLKRNMKCNILLEVDEILRENEKIILNISPIQIKTKIIQDIELEENLNIGYQLKYSDIDTDTDIEN